VSSNSLFERNDYDFSATLGALSKRLYERYRMEEHRDEAVRAISTAISAAEKLGLSEAPLRLALTELGVGENTKTSRRGNGRPNQFVGVHRGITKSMDSFSGRP